MISSLQSLLEAGDWKDVQGSQKWEVLRDPNGGVKVPREEWVCRGFQFLPGIERNAIISIVICGSTTQSGVNEVKVIPRLGCLLHQVSELRQAELFQGQGFMGKFGHLDNEMGEGTL